ncbi:MAG TPA: alanine--tRNA ligase, partial [Acidimicrobiales bacterium]|nr:alanine--tRNA ligase [Acidimicrobiales bacterium]
EPFASFSTSLVRPVIAAAEAGTRTSYGSDPSSDVALRVLADHARAMTFLVADGVMPSNEGRGYVLRRVIRRAVLRAFQLGADKPITPALVAAVAETTGVAYPEVRTGADRISDVVGREEERFRQTLRSGFALLDEELAGGARVVSGEMAFRLHDTHGFPIELTKEIAGECGVEVDAAGFESAMAEQRARGRKVGKEQLGVTAADERYRQLLDQHGPTRFLGYSGTEATGRVLAVIERDETTEVYLDRTPFYAEGGGQIGDTGRITTPTGTFEVTDTTYALPGLHRHVGRIVEGEISPGQDATASVDAERRDDIRRNHTGTHLLQWALREVLGDHVQQQGSLVGPDYLRFDFSHHAAPTPEELSRIQDLANEAVITDAPVSVYETSMKEAREKGAIAFFGDKYGDEVRVVEAGPVSVELCGGTHVGALGMIGPLRIVSESSIGANTRRIFAVTGHRALERIDEQEATIAKAAGLLRSPVDELTDAVNRLLERQRGLEDELKALRNRGLADKAAELAAAAVPAGGGDGGGGAVVARVDGLTPDQLRELAVETRRRPEVGVVVLGGSPDGQRVARVAAARKGSGLSAPDLVAAAARLVGGGGGGRNPELATAGGRDVGRLNEALELVREKLAGSPSAR